MPAPISVGDSEKAQAILTYLRRHAAVSDFPPSREEIRDATGLNSTATVQRWLTRLAAAGLVRMEPNKARAIRPTSPR